ncbi:MAG TPA: porin family protein [Puia sp.]|jgi:hypothetical protein|nr:porin family protein [Puia sp.]
MKKLALILIAGISFATAQAQFQFGAKAGLNLANISDIQGYSANTQFNFNVGVFFKMPVARHVSIQPELVYSGQGFRYNDAGSPGSDHLNYINLPILVKLTSRTGFYFETGPQFGFLASAHDTYQDVTADVKSQYKSGDFGWVFGIGAKIPLSPIGVDLRYNAGMSNIFDYQGADGPSVRNGVWQLGLTYVLFSSGRK